MPSTKPYADRLNDLAQKYGPLRVLTYNLSGNQVDAFAWTLGDGEGAAPQQKIIFRPPIGTTEEIAGWLRDCDNGRKKWPGAWWSAVRYAEFYTATGRPAIHTGEDLNLSLPGDVYADTGKPVFAIADGVTMFAGQLPTWGYVIVVEHNVAPGVRVWSRYAHLDPALRIKPSEIVTYGQQIANIGDYGQPGKPGDHLHFDLAVTDCLVSAPAHWPGNDLTAVKQHYTEPLTYLVEHRQ